MNVNDIRELFKQKLANEEFVIDKTGVKTIEIVGSSFIADEKTIIGSLNSYVDRELQWYMSQSLNVNDIPGGTPEIWKQVASKKGLINSNYGWCVFSKANGHQYNNVLHELACKPNSRRAIMIYTRPTMHYDYCVDGMSDFMCTNTVQYMIRDGKLTTLVNMRSNDIHVGFKNDKFWQDYVADNLCLDLGVHKGDMIWQAGSLHCYERDFDKITEIVEI